MHPVYGIFKSSLNIQESRIKNIWPLTVKNCLKCCLQQFKIQCLVKHVKNIFRNIVVCWDSDSCKSMIQCYIFNYVQCTHVSMEHLITGCNSFRASPKMESCAPGLTCSNFFFFFPFIDKFHPPVCSTVPAGLQAQGHWPRDCNKG